MPGHRLTWVDVFTGVPLAGNALAVVHAADDLDDDAMLAFARETRLSETTFVQRATGPGADFRNRIWMTTGELAFAGHPSLGTAVAVALERGDRKACLVQETGAGLHPIDVEVRDDGVARASMLQEPLLRGPDLDRDEVLRAVGLGPEDLDPRFEPCLLSTGAAQVVVPVRAEALQRPRPVFERLDALLAPHDGVVAYLAACDPGAGRARARAFFPDVDGVTEDPATGSAAGPLCAYLHESAGITRLCVEQGAEMGRPSRLDCEMAGDRVRVGGECVVVATGTLHL